MHWPLFPMSQIGAGGCLSSMQTGAASDRELLSEYAQHGSEEVFARLVRRHIS